MEILYKVVFVRISIKIVFNEQFDGFHRIEYSRGINYILIPLFFFKNYYGIHICNQVIY